MTSTFEYADDYGYYYAGWWYKWGTTYAFDWDEGCYAFYSGTLAKGFMKCADGNDIGYDPGIYQLKKTNCKYVHVWITAKMLRLRDPIKKGLRPTIHNKQKIYSDCKERGTLPRSHYA